ncbi:MAG: outer membrane lipid asymmetry maintenance protein MlaD [Nitrospirota bacterium]
MKRITTETLVGLFIVIGLASLAYLAIKLGDINLFKTDEYVVRARFVNVSGLKVGSEVEIAGVKVGKVSKIYLDNSEAIVELLIDDQVKIPDDSSASIRTQGIIGDKFIKISPGGSEDYIAANGIITETESAVDIEQLISKYIFEKK